MNISNNTWKYALLGLGVFAATLSGCKKDDDLVENPDGPHHDEEVITTITLTFTDSAGVQPTVTATFRDPDGDGGLDPDIHDTIRLAANTTYDVDVTLLNETETPAEDITEEVIDEAHEHLFCYTVAGANVTIQRTDTDGTYELGVESKWTVGAMSNGSVQVELKHQPDVKDGTCDPGDTDIDVTFVTEIQ